MAKSNRLSESEVKALIAAERSASLSSVTTSSSTLTSDRRKALRYYRGDVSDDIPIITGRSTVVSYDVSDTIEGLLPSLMEIFAGSDDAVRFEAIGPEDIDAADQETEYIKHVFWNQNDGYLTLYSMIKDALLEKLGIVKVWWDNETRMETETYYDQSDMQLSLIMQNKDVVIVAHSQKMDEFGQTLHDVQVEKKVTWGYAHCEAVPPEEFGIAKRARKIKDSPYCFHEIISTEAQLIKDGFDPDQVRGLPSYGNITNAEIFARDTVEENSQRGDSSVNQAMRPIRLTEHYCKFDYERRGKSEAKLYQVITGGEDQEVLQRQGGPSISEWDQQPFAGITPFVMTHRVFGMSVAEVIMDIQRVKTVLMRAMLDNAYATNMPRPVVSSQLAGESTLDDLAVFRHGAPIRTKQPGAIEWQKVPTIIDTVFPIVQYMDSLREWRTGVTRQGAGLDADALNNQTATAAMQMYNAAQARMKLIARTFAETGIKDLFYLLHSTVLKHKNQADIIRLTNKWIPVDPRNWKERNDITVSVGLGQGGKTERMMMLQKLMDMQQLAVQGGLVELVTPKNLYNSAREVAKIIEVPVELFFTDPGDEAKLNPKQPPEMIKAQTEMQKLQYQGQADQQKMQAQFQMDQQTNDHRMNIERIQAQADVASQDRKTQAEIALAQKKFELERELAIMEFNMKSQTNAQELEMKKQNTMMGMAQSSHQHQMDVEKAEMGIHTSAQEHAMGMHHEAQSAQHAADTHAHKMKQMQQEQGGGPISSAIKNLQSGQKEHGKALADILEAVNQDREITLTRDAKGKAAGAVSKRRKNGATPT